MTSRSRAFLVILALSVGGSLAAQTPPASKPIPQTYGTSAITYFGVPATAFRPIASGIDHSGGPAGTYSTTCGGPCMTAPLQLPGGAIVVSVELDYLDNSATEWVTGSLVQCTSMGQNCILLPSGGAGPADCVIPGQLCSGKAFNLGPSATTADASGDGITIDNLNRSYSLVGGACCTGNSKLAGMIVGYVLQVSPAPGAASFVDVPTNHPYFQFIEALYASGITSGCFSAPLQYCPDRPITRGEMAVYLARALGLQFSF